MARVSRITLGILVIFLVLCIGGLLCCRPERFAAGGAGGAPIPKIIFQTSVNPQDDYVVHMIGERAPGWEYRHYTDQDILQYFETHPLPEFPQIADQFHRLHGAHKADLFRYYFIYVEGGVFLDSDAIILVNLDDLVQNYGFVSVNSVCSPHNVPSIFQGFLGATPRNPIIYKALKDAYTTPRADLDENYFLWVERLHTFVHETNYDFPIKLYEESVCNEEDQGKGVTYDGDKPVIYHYYAAKKIPSPKPT